MTGGSNAAEIAATEAELAAAEEELRLDMLQASLDLAGIADPTPTSDALGAGLSLYRGDLLGAGLSLVSMVPYVGDAVGKTAKGAKLMAKIAAGKAKVAALMAKLAKLKAVKSGLNAAASAKAAASRLSRRAANGAAQKCPLLAKAPKSFQKAPTPGVKEPGAIPNKGHDAELYEGKLIEKTGKGMTKDGWPPLEKETVATFKGDPVPEYLPPGTKLRRVVGEGGSPYGVRHPPDGSPPKDAAGSFWVKADDFPATEADWRAGSAVKGEWNGDGGYVEYTVPEPGMNVWTGPARAQKSSDGVSVLPGGKEQIVLDGAELSPNSMSDILSTGW